MSVFGEILYLFHESGTIVFVAVMLFLTFFEASKFSISCCVQLIYLIIPSSVENSSSFP